MARYDFRCEGCQAITTVEQPMADPLAETTPCEQCPGDARRVFQPPTVHYKGRGFYTTDVKGSQERRRRPNPGDKLYTPHDPAAAAIARSL